MQAAEGSLLLAFSYTLKLGSHAGHKKANSGSLVSEELQDLPR